MKFIGIILIFYSLACSQGVGPPSVSALHTDSEAGREEENPCSSQDKGDEVILIDPALRGKCDHIPKPSHLYHVNRRIINGQVCCELRLYIDHGNGQITPISG